MSESMNQQTKTFLQRRLNPRWRFVIYPLLIITLIANGFYGFQFNAKTQPLQKILSKSNKAELKEDESWKIYFENTGKLNRILIQNQPEPKYRILTQKKISSKVEQFTFLNNDEIVFFLNHEDEYSHNVWTHEQYRSWKLSSCYLWNMKIGEEKHLSEKNDLIGERVSILPHSKLIVGVKKTESAELPLEKPKKRVVYVENLETGEITEIYSDLRVHTSLADFSFSETSKVFSLGDRTMSSLFNRSKPESRSETKIWNYEEKPKSIVMKGIQYEFISLLPSGQLFLDDSLNIRSIPSQKIVTRLNLDYATFAYRFTEFSRSGNLLASIGKDEKTNQSKLVVLDWKKNEIMMKHDGKILYDFFSSFSNSEKLIATLTWRCVVNDSESTEMIITLWNIPESKKAAQFVIPWYYTGGIRFSPDDKLLAIGCYNGIFVYDVKNLLENHAPPE